MTSEGSLVGPDFGCLCLVLLEDLMDQPNLYQSLLPGGGDCRQSCWSCDIAGYARTNYLSSFLSLTAAK